MIVDNVTVNIKKDIDYIKLDRHKELNSVRGVDTSGSIGWYRSTLWWLHTEIRPVASVLHGDKTIVLGAFRSLAFPEIEFEEFRDKGR